MDLVNNSKYSSKGGYEGAHIFHQIANRQHTFKTINSFAQAVTNALNSPGVNCSRLHKFRKRCWLWVALNIEFHCNLAPLIFKFVIIFAYAIRSALRGCYQSHYWSTITTKNTMAYLVRLCDIYRERRWYLLSFCETIREDNGTSTTPWHYHHL